MKKNCQIQSCDTSNYLHDERLTKNLLTYYLGWFKIERLEEAETIASINQLKLLWDVQMSKWNKLFYSLWRKKNS